MTACTQDGNTETVVVCIAFVPTEARNIGCGSAETSKKALNWIGAPSLSCQIEEKALFLL